MSDTNKVTFGLENLYIGTYTVAANGTVTLGTPVHQPGAVSMSMSPETEESTFYADNVAYWSQYLDNGFTGSLEVAKFDDAFKTAFLGYREGPAAVGGIGQVKGATKPAVFLIWEFKGDQQRRRCVAYNVALGNIDREYNTTEDTIEVQTETIDFTVTGDNGTGITTWTFPEDAAAYNTLFTAPPVPADLVED